MQRDCILCRFLAQSAIFVGLGLALLALLWLLRAWLWLALLVYLGLIVLVGLLALASVAKRIIVKLCRKWGADPKGGGSGGHPESVTVHVPGTIYKRPDPLIYSQAWLLARGLAVTWDNPDIALFELQLGGLPPKPAQAHALKPGAKHLIRVRIWNGSTSAPAVNLLVRFWVLTFGIGTTRTIIGETLVPNLPVKGAVGLPATAEIVWTTPPLAGHICVQVELVWPDDEDQGNNIGQINLDVKKLNSPNASFTFALRNDSAVATALRLTSDAYRLPALLDCGATSRGGRPVDATARHRPEFHALPEGWRVSIAGAADDIMAAGEERAITVNVVAADGFVGERDINVNAFDGLRPVGGVTLRVYS